MNRVTLNQSAIRAFATTAESRALLEHVGRMVATDAATAAPKDTGAGARSIGYEVDGDTVRISWDADHFYMIFSELGTSRQSPRPFLRPALSKRRILR